MTGLTGTSELISLFLIVLLIYVIQCICWVTPQAIVFTLGLRGRGRRSQRYVWSARDTAGLLANPLPPLTPLAAAYWPAFELTPDAIQLPGRDGDGGDPVSISWEKLTVSHSETRLHCNGTLAFKGGEVQVLQYVALLGQLQAAHRAQRVQIIQDWQRRMLSIQTASRRLRIFAGRAPWLRALCNLQFVFLFFLLPLGFYFFGTMIWWRALLILLVFSITITLEFWTLHKILFPSASEQRFKTAVIVVVSPVAAIRASDVVARDVLGGFHPLAVAGAILPEEEFRQFAGEQLRLCHFGDYADKQYQAGLEKAMEQALKKSKLNPQELLRPPEPDAGCVVYCPRCLAQYTKTREECSDCGYQALAQFTREQQSAKPKKSKR